MKKSFDKVYNTVLSTINENQLMKDKMHIVLGLSGGPDSLCLFYVLLSLAERGEADIKLYPVHVNHKFRPGAAEADQKFVEELCRDFGLECSSFVYDCNAIAAKEGITSEEAGRMVRYEAFAKVANSIVDMGVHREQVAIAVAQNANDQCETILFRIMRGTGISGLSGIAYKRFDDFGTAVIRPLLDVDREDIEKYCADNNLSPRIDGTNSQPLYTRNKIRLELIPYIKEHFNENIIETVNRLGKLAAADKDYMDEETKMAYETVSNQCLTQAKEQIGSVSLNIDSLKNYHKAIRLRVFGRALKSLGLRDNVSYAHLEAVDGLMKSESPSAAVDLPAGMTAFKTYDTLVLKRKKTEEGLAKVNNKPEILIKVTDAGEYKKETSEGAARFSLESLKKVYGPSAEKKISLRKRQPGDFMTISVGGALHRKKLQDMLVDLKMPKAYRDDLWTVAIGMEILWLLPSPHFVSSNMREKGRFSAEYRVDQNCDTVIISLEKL